MAAYFLDSSAIVKCYLDERGSLAMRAITRPSSRNDVFVSRLAAVEVFSSIARRMLPITGPDYELVSLYSVIRQDLANLYSFVELDETVANSAIAVAQNGRLRTLDSIQLASALRVQSLRSGPGIRPVTFVTADLKLAQAARDVGFEVYDPNESQN